MKNFIEIKITQLMIWIIKKGYGADCETYDLEDYPETFTKPKDVFHHARCGSCQAKEIIEWLEGHIDLIKY